MFWNALKTRWLKARIAYHRRKADDYSRPVARSVGRDRYVVWLRNEALRHAKTAHELQRRLLPDG